MQNKAFLILSFIFIVSFSGWSQKTKTSIQPNVEYKDENGDSICGATNLLS